MFYKLVENNIIIGVVTGDDFRKYQVKHKRILISDEENAQFVEYKDVYYCDDWLRALPDGSGIILIPVDIVRIEEEEYNNLKEQLDEGDFPTDDSLEEEIIVNDNTDDEEPVVVQKTVAQILDEQIKLAAIFAEV